MLFSHSDYFQFCCCLGIMLLSCKCVKCGFFFASSKYVYLSSIFLDIHVSTCPSVCYIHSRLGKEGNISIQCLVRYINPGTYFLCLLQYVRETSIRSCNLDPYHALHFAIISVALALAHIRALLLSCCF